MASLIPAHDATCEHKRKLAGFNETVSVLSSEIFTDLIKKVRVVSKPLCYMTKLRQGFLVHGPGSHRYHCWG
jgi:hypothetical protein